MGQRRVSTTDTTKLSQFSQILRLERWDYRLKLGSTIYINYEEN